VYPGKKLDSGRYENDPYIAIDLESVATELGCTPALLFGRLYYHLAYKYRYEQADGSKVEFFSIQVGEKRHAVQFPYLASILASMNQEFHRVMLTVVFSSAALAVSVLSLIVGIVRHGH
jgi:hypothetical protein